ncbi:DUF397 domain-containing protein [Streptomyces sp. LBL]|uniref:DUF397 domain-containing protein n=1 Tax=Streptomyces sp. LBL TaxID=2940562 RepID=UPI002474EFD3|nr:DUF397 domain-containing protein [Streptomyces sp. LBL]
MAARRHPVDGDEGGQCVEVATCPHTIHIRDSKSPQANAPTLQVAPTTWAAFTSGLK